MATDVQKRDAQAERDLEQALGHALLPSAWYDRVASVPSGNDGLPALLDALLVSPAACVPAAPRPAASDTSD